MSFSKISVVMSVFNDIQHISSINRNLDILKNSENIHEIIVVDDCSIDVEFLNFLKSISKLEKVKVLFKNRNEGLYLSRVSGLIEAISEYIYFIDSDDDLILPPDISVSESKYGSVFDFIGSHENGELRKEIGFKYDYSLNENFIRNLSSNVLWNKVYLKEVFIGLPIVELRNADDIFMNIYFCSRVSGLKYYESELIKYNVRLGSLSKKISRFKYRDIILAVFYLKYDKVINFKDSLYLMNNFVIRNYLSSLKRDKCFFRESFSLVLGVFYAIKCRLYNFSRFERVSKK